MNAGLIRFARNDGARVFQQALGAGLLGQNSLDLAEIGCIFALPIGGVPERPKGTDCKSVGEAFGGSNPPPST
jgi:hypothetical protein